MTVPLLDCREEAVVPHQPRLSATLPAYTTRAHRAVGSAPSAVRSLTFGSGEEDFCRMLPSVRPCQRF